MTLEFGFIDSMISSFNSRRPFIPPIYVRELGLFPDSLKPGGRNIHGNTGQGLHVTGRGI
jgi:hypothetical protein